MSKDKKTSKPVKKPGIVSNEIKDFSNDPFIIKKNEKAKKMVERVGFSGRVFEK